MARKKQALSIEDKEYIKTHLKTRTVEQMSSVLSKPLEIIGAFVQELLPPKEEVESKPTQTLLQGMMSPRPGVTIMTEAASQIADDVRGRSGVTKYAKNAIHKPRG